MGLPNFRTEAVPMLNVTPEAAQAGEVVDQPYAIGGGSFKITCLSMGNPHCVIFVPDVDQVDVARFGPVLERAPIFPKRANISFAQVESPTRIRLRVWERGIGETRSCGTAACATAAAAVKLGHSPENRGHPDQPAGRSDHHPSDRNRPQDDRRRPARLRGRYRNLAIQQGRRAGKPRPAASACCQTSSYSPFVSGGMYAGNVFLHPARTLGAETTP